MNPLAKFKVYPASRRSLYFTVFVWRTLAVIQLGGCAGCYVTVATACLE